MSSESSGSGDRRDGERPTGGPSGLIADSILDAAGDLDHTNARLRAREATLLDEYERNAEALRALGPGANRITGRGWAGDQIVVVEVDAGNRMTDLHLDPRALRLGSIDNLRRAIMTAFDNACEDVADQMRDLGLATIGEDPVRRMLEGMPELTALLPDQAYDALVAPDAPAADADDTEPADPDSDDPHRERAPGSSRRY